VAIDELMREPDTALAEPTGGSKKGADKTESKES
jgi:hypothetical protein